MIILSRYIKITIWTEVDFVKGFIASGSWMNLSEL